MIMASVKRPLQILCKPPVWYRIEKSCRRKLYAKVQGQSGRTGGKLAYQEADSGGFDELQCERSV